MGRKNEEKLGRSYKVTITVISGWLKFTSLCFTIPALIAIHSITDWFLLKFGLSLLISPLLGVGYGIFFLDVLRLDKKVEWFRLMFFDIVLTLGFLVTSFISRPFVITSLSWSLLSVIGILLAPIPAHDPGVSKVSRVVGFLILGLGLTLKFVDTSGLLLELTTFFPVLGGILSIAGMGRKIKG